jgi:hypothetical protein
MKFQKTTMKKSIIILVITAFIAGGCGEQATPPPVIQQELTQEQVNEDSLWLLEKKKHQSEFYSHPLVSAEEIAMITPVIKKWTNFYNIDFAQARLVNRSENVCFNAPPDTTSSYYREFTKKEDTDKRIDVDYSPDKQRYVDLGIIYDERDGKRYCFGWDDCQEIYLVDRKQKHQNMILWFGTTQFAEAVFWQSNNVFMITGYCDFDYFYGHFIDVFDIAKQTTNRYAIFIPEENTEFSGYMNKVYLKEKGILTED